MLEAVFASIALNIHLMWSCSYFVTELLGTDLHRLLTSRPLEKQFIQYFLYQIMVSAPLLCTWFSSQLVLTTMRTAWPQVRPLGRCCPSRPEAQQHPGQRELRLEDLRLRLGTDSGSPDDGIRVNPVLPRSGDHAHVAEVRC